MRADLGKSRREGGHTANPFCGGGMAIFWNHTITKRAQHCDLHVFVFFEIAEVYSRLAGCRVYEGHLQNERVIKTFQKHPKSSKFVCIDSSLQFTFL